MSKSPQDGEPGTSTAPPSAREHRTRPGAVNEEVADFEIKMCALTFLRAVQSNSSFTNFTMTSNDPRAADFNDIVFSYGSPGSKQYILVHLETKKAPRLKTSETTEHFENCTYVFFTNADVKFTPRVANIDSPAKKLFCTTWRPEDVCQVDLADNMCKNFKVDTGAEEFVNKLLIFRNQYGPKVLEELIKQELIKICNGVVTQCHIIMNKFVEKIKAWWEEPENGALDENWKEWTELKEQFLGQKTLLQQIKFREDILLHLETRVLDSECDIILLKCERDEAQIACSKVHQTCIRKEHLGVFFTDISEPLESLNMLFTLWIEDVCNVLVITDVTNCNKYVWKIIGNFKCNLKKKIVILSSREADQLGFPKAHEFSPDFIKSTFNQLDGKSQDRLRNLEVDFHGKSVTLGSIQAYEVLDGGLLQDVLTSRKIQIFIRRA
ncbi:uncharacterized protein [Anabrus simplex]|uniref:uncharacterized protein n=1 Tax=Anabrus simplex TaxID=316456 RepID=UPI0035A396AE